MNRYWNTGKGTWGFVSQKMKTVFQFRSEGEARIAAELEKDPDVKRYYYEKTVVCYARKGRLLDYIVDFDVHSLTLGVIHLEAKPGGHKPNSTDRQKWSAAREKYGSRFVVSNSWGKVKSEILSRLSSVESAKSSEGERFKKMLGPKLLHHPSVEGLIAEVEEGRSTVESALLRGWLRAARS